MKIHSVEFSNLNSLKGEWRIDFDAPDFVESGLFAITGPTGAGKTTILDAICLALYHETPRLKKASNKKNEIMTRHEKECSAEVVFSVKGQRYIAFWSQARARAGATNPFGTVKVDLIKVTDEETGEGTSLTTKTVEKQNLIEDLTGLTFSRFTRSVLLAQGSFAAFLKADQNEKSEMLEQMTGSEVYGLISIKVFERSKEEKSKVDLLESKLSAFDLLDKEAEKQLSEEYEELTKEQRKADEKLKSLNEQVLVRRDIQKLEKEQAQVGLDLAQAQQKKRDNKDNQARLEAYLPAMALQVPARELSSLNERLQKNKSQCKDLRLQEKEILNAEKQQSLLCDTAEEKLHKTSEENRLQEKLIHEEVIPLDGDISRLGENLKDGTNKVGALRKNRDSLEKKGADYLRQLKKLKQQLAESQLYLKENEGLGLLLESRSLIDDLLKRRPQIYKRILEHENDDKNQAEAYKAAQALGLSLQKQCEEQKRQWQEKTSARKILADDPALLADEAEAEKNYAQWIGRRALAEQIPQNSDNLMAVKKNLDECHQRLFLLNNRQQKLKQDIVDRKQAVLKAEEGYENARRLFEKDRIILDLSQHRQSLQEGESCPLCGSLEHPAVDEYAQKEIQRSRKDVQSTEKILQEARDNASKVEQQIHVANSQKEGFESAVASDTALYQQYAGQWNEMCAKLGAQLDAFDKANCEKFLSQFEKDFQSVSAERENIRKKRQDFQELENLCHQYQQNYQKIHFDYQKNIELQERHQNDATNRVQQRENLIEERTLLDEQLKALLNKTAYDMPEAFQESALCKSLELNFGKYESVVGECNKLQNEISGGQQEAGQLEEGIKNAREQLNEAQVALSQLEASQKGLLEKRQKLFVDKNPQVILESMIQQQQNLTADFHGAQKVLRELESRSVACQTALATRLDEQERLLTERSEKRELFDRDLLAAGFSDIEAYGKALLSNDEYNRLKKLKEDCDEQVTQTKTRMDAILKRLGEARSRCIGDEELSVLEERLLTDKESLEKLIHSRAQKKARLDANNTTKERFSKTHEAIEEQKKKWVAWAGLSELIGSRDGKMFRRYAQSITLDYLTVLANQHLRVLHGRYELRGAKDLGLDVIDTYQADVVRPVETLSGGESFLVSLSLALGLSDLASSKVSIESLFLDEGFGTLDPETLDVVLDALDKLHAGGKMIGVISHVESLKQRIGLRIEVQSGKGLGLSSLDERFRKKRESATLS